MTRKQTLRSIGTSDIATFKIQGHIHVSDYGNCASGSGGSRIQKNLERLYNNDLYEELDFAPRSQLLLLGLFSELAIQNLPCR